VQIMLTRLLRLRSVPYPSDAADGVAAALTYCLTAAAPPGGLPMRSTRLARAPAP
jgi:Holliday junction resolvasome RuvABC endonuclease subunit